MTPVESVQSHFQRIDDVLFGKWTENEKKETTRTIGLIEQVASIKSMIIKICLYGGIGLLVVVLHTLGVPTETVWHLVSGLIGHIGLF